MRGLVDLLAAAAWNGLAHWQGLSSRARIAVGVSPPSGRTSADGVRMGTLAAGFANRGAAHIVEEGETDDRCKSCAFSEGTVPNGCLQTQMDALKALVEKVPFCCHQADRAGALCAGYYQAQVAIRRATLAGAKFPIERCDWEFSVADSPDPGIAAANTNTNTNTNTKGDQHG